MEIVRKNLKTRKGTQRWRKNIAITGTRDEGVDFPSKREESKIGFTIDTKPVNIYENKNRFKKKEAGKQSEYEAKLVKKIKTQVQPHAPSHPIKKPEQELHDLWDNENAEPSKKREDSIRTIVQPHAGQSYNPQYNDYQQLVDGVIEQELRSQQKRVNAPRKTLPLPEQASREKLRDVEKRQGKAAMEQLIEKQKNHQITLLKRYKKELKAEDVIREERQLARERERELEREAAKKQGRLLKNRKVGKRILSATQDEFVAEDELKQSLRQVSQEERLVRSQFEGYYRRGQLEPKSRSNKMSGSKQARYRVKERKRHDEE